MDTIDTVRQTLQSRIVTAKMISMQIYPSQTVKISSNYAEI